MASVNKATVLGNLGGDPEIGNVNGTVNAKFTVATNMRWTDRNGEKQQRVEWHNVTAWARTAEIVRDYLKKGSPVYIEGRLQTDSWDGECGKKHYRTHVVVERLQLLGQRDTSLDDVLEAAGAAPIETPMVNTAETEDLPL